MAHYVWNKEKNEKVLVADVSSAFKGTHDEWDALTDEEKAQYETVIFTDDYGERVIDDEKTSIYSTWSSKKINDSLVDIEGELGDLIKSNMEGSEGYLELPNKLCLEWGSNTIASGGTMVEVSLKKITSYSNVQITCFSYAGAHSSFYGWLDSTVKDGFRIYQKDAVTQPRIYKWLAIGICD